EEAERNGFLLEEKVLVKQTPKHQHFRAMLLFGKENQEVINHEIMIKNHDGVYSDEFIYLLKDYYLD
ncbi:MAG: hypothetical protein ABIN48_12010, partial [Ginsengibacter sp.]